MFKEKINKLSWRIGTLLYVKLREFKQWIKRGCRSVYSENLTVFLESTAYTGWYLNKYDWKFKVKDIEDIEIITIEPLLKTWYNNPQIKTKQWIRESNEKIRELR